MTIKLLCLDRGFYSVPIIRWLKALDFPFLMPAVIRGKTCGTRALLIGRKSYATDYTINSPKYGSITCQMRVVCGYHKGFKGQHGIRYLIYAVHRVKIALNQLHHYYHQRFGIETSYRLKNHCRIWATTNWHQLKFSIHHKQRYTYKLEQQIKCLKIAQIRVKVSHYEVFVVGSKDESYGNQVCQWDGDIIKFRVPYSLGSKYGKYVELV